jgi:hypothetical protein
MSDDIPREAPAPEVDETGGEADVPAERLSPAGQRAMQGLDEGEPKPAKVNEPADAPSPAAPGDPPPPPDDPPPTDNPPWRLDDSGPAKADTERGLGTLKETRPEHSTGVRDYDAVARANAEGIAKREGSTEVQEKPVPSKKENIQYGGSPEGRG